METILLSDAPKGARDLTPLQMKNIRENFLDVIEAIYWFCADNHTGQNSELYSILCQIGKHYQPGAYQTGCQEDSTSQFFYEDFTEKAMDLTETANYVLILLSDAPKGARTLDS